MNEFIEEAIKESRVNEENHYMDGGPFGAVIVKDGKIISRAHNTVLKNKDATAHAEVNAIREASKLLGTHDLSGCVLYTSAEPCPMCLSAIIWANIKEVYYVLTKEEAGEIGFRDDIIYDYIKGKNKDLIRMSKIDEESAKMSFISFENDKMKKIY